MSDTAVESAGACESGRKTFRDRAAEMLLRRVAPAVRDGYIEVEDGPERFVIGDENAALRTSIQVRHPAFYRSVIRGGVVGAAEAYMDGAWTCSDLTALIRIIQRNEDALRTLDSGWARFAAPIRKAIHRLRRNTRIGSKRNIAKHYDLGNDFYRLFLDETMTYSSGYFERTDATMSEASIAKIDRLCRMLRLEASDHLVEIGSGWGAFAIHAAGTYGCRVTTTTISREQFVYAAERIREAGLEDRIELLFKDYRDLTGTYDKLVSVEMIEAVGYEYFDDYFAQCSRLLKPEGLMAIQAITTADQRFETGKKDVDFIKRYIFPGGCLPSIASMADSVTRATDLRLIGLDDIAPHYAETLRRWRMRFDENRAAIRALGYDERFLRMWEFYLRYCEAAFDEHYTAVVHALFAKPRAAMAMPGQ